MASGRQVYDLESNAPTVRLQHERLDKDGKVTEQVWEISFSDGRPTGVYLDTGTAQAVRLIRSWAAKRCRRAGRKGLISALPTLVVSGLIKTGKSYTLNEVVAAVLAEALAREPPGHPLKGIQVLRLNCLDLQRQGGAGTLLYDLLTVVMEWAVTAGVRVDEVEWCKAQAVLADGPNHMAVLTRAGRAVAQLFERGFQSPVLVLTDELQALLQPTASDAAGGPPRLDEAGAAYIRDVVLRRILVNSPPHVLWGVTGSSMALVWISLAAMPVHGTAPLNQIKTVHLPASVSPRLMLKLAAHILRRQLGGLSEPQLQKLEQLLELEQQAVEQAEQPPQQAEEQAEQPPQQAHVVEQVKTLMERSGNSPALFSTMLELWDVEKEEASVDITTFVDGFMTAKLFQEAVKGWHPALAPMSDEGRRGVLDLANSVLGAKISDFPDQGLWRFLEPYMLMTEHGRYYLADPMQRLLLWAAVERGGKLRTSFTGLGEGLTLVQLDFGLLVLQLGEVADYLAGQRRRPKGFPSSVFKGATELTAMLTEFATKAKLPKLPHAKDTSTAADRWGALRAFQLVLDSPCNSGSRTWYDLEGKNKRLRSDLDYLVFFLRLCRNVLAHHWQQQQGTLDILEDVVMALPELLGVSAQQLAERVRTCLSQLQPDTIQAAAAAAAADDAGEGEEREELAGAASPAGSTSSAGSTTGLGDMASDSTPSGGSAPSLPSAGYAGSDSSAKGPHASAPIAGATAASTTAAGAVVARGAAGSATASAPSAATGASAPSAGIGIGGGACSASNPSASASSGQAITGPPASASRPSAPNTSASAPSAGGAGASEKRGGRLRSSGVKHGSGGAGSGASPAGSGGGAPSAPAAAGGRGQPGSSCSKAHTVLSSSSSSSTGALSAPAAARRCRPLLTGKAAVVPAAMRAMRPAPPPPPVVLIVRRLNRVRVTMATTPAAFRFSS